MQSCTCRKKRHLFVKSSSVVRRIHWRIHLVGRLHNHYCCCIVLQGVAVCCSELQCAVTASRRLECSLGCSVLQCVAACCSVLQCVSVCCSVLLQCHADFSAPLVASPVFSKKTKHIPNIYTPSIFLYFC